MKKYYPSKISLHILRVLGLALSILVTYLAAVFLTPYPIIMKIVIALFWTAYFSVLLIAFPIYFHRTNYYVSSGEVSKQSGIIYYTKQLMRTESVQYMTLFSTPLSKYTGFNFVVFNALGGKVVFFFLSSADADEITALVSAAIRQKQK